MVTLEQLRLAGVLAALDVHFARTVARLAKEDAPEVVVAAALASRQVRQGHVCLDLPAFVAEPRLIGNDEQPLALDWPAAERWLQQLRASPLVGDAEAITPLVLDDRGRLYLRRYYEHERALAAGLRARASRAGSVAIPPGALERLFPRSSDGTDWQRFAAWLATRSHLCVISGGPGTGKTFTVVKVLALLIEQALQAGETPPRIALAAPTGKAAARLTEAIGRAKQTLACEEHVRESIPDHAGTIHRLLGSIEASPTRFRHHAGNRLPADIVLIDEASMVDLALMRRLVDAVPEDARLILLGDKDQLASVEAGAVLGDICNTGGERSYSQGLAGDWRQLTGETLSQPGEAAQQRGISDCIVELTHSYRYDAASGIGELARAIKAGDTERVLALLDADGSDVSWIAPLPDGSPPLPWLRQRAAGFHPALRSGEPIERLRALGACRLLCAHRRGRSGVEAVNRAIEEILESAGLIDSSSPNYPGRPIIITRNDYQAQLFNGDTGILLADESGNDDGPRTLAYFESAGGTVRRLAPARLPPNETVFAMSIHKSQGSELDEVAVVLPAESSPILSRELLYTAVTRARQRVTVCATREAIVAAVRRRVERASGLREALWQ